ncbi:MAG: hypothetical protein WAW13_05130 [Minisyncoccia bacterium]
MNRSICIVTSGDPGNTLDYHKVFDPLRQLFESTGDTVTLVKDAKEGIRMLQAEALACYEAKLPSKRKYVVFVSAYYCEEALELARMFSPSIRFVVHSVGLAPLHMPTFAFRGMLTENTVDDIFS